MMTAMRVWVSPNGVQHVVPPHGACATCGNSRHEVCAHCGEDVHRSQPTGSGWLWAHDNDGTTLCVVGGARTGTRAEPKEQRQEPVSGAGLVSSSLTGQEIPVNCGGREAPA